MGCTCKNNKVYKKSDWSYWKKTCDYCIGLGHGKEIFIKYTLCHKIRLFIGLTGQMQDGSYCFGKLWLNKILNFLIGYKKIIN